MSQTEESEKVHLPTDGRSREEFFAFLVNQYSKQLYWKRRSIVLYHDDADDALQNTFMKVWRCLDDFQGKSKLSTWLYSIAIHEALGVIRHRKNLVVVGSSEETSVTNRLMADEYFDGDDGLAILQEAIARLPYVQRTVFVLRYYDEMKYSDISEMLGTSEGALKASYHIAVRKITNYIKAHS